MQGHTVCPGQEFEGNSAKFGNLHLDSRVFGLERRRDSFDSVADVADVSERILSWIQRRLGNLESQALGAAATGIIGEDLLGLNERIAVQAGFGASVREEKFGGQRSSTVFGGRAGFQISW